MYCADAYGRRWRGGMFPGIPGMFRCLLLLVGGIRLQKEGGGVDINPADFTAPVFGGVDFLNALAHKIHIAVRVLAIDYY